MTDQIFCTLAPPNPQSGITAVGPLDEISHRGPGDSVSEILEGTLDSAVTRVRILPSHHY